MSSSFPLDGMRVRFAGDTDIGRKRDHNEDSIYLPSDIRLAIVADGMGGHASGDVASQLAVETLVDYFEKTDEMQPLTWPYKVDRDIRSDTNRMIQGIMLANLEIHERGGSATPAPRAWAPPSCPSSFSTTLPSSATWATVAFIACATDA